MGIQDGGERREVHAKLLFGKPKGRNCFGNRHKWEDNIKMGVKYTECKDR